MLMKKSKRHKLLNNKLRLPLLKKHPLLIKNIIASNTKEESKHGIKTNLTSKENGRRKESHKQQKINLNKINNHGKSLKNQLKEKVNKKLNKSNRKETGKENKVTRKRKWKAKEKAKRLGNQIRNNKVTPIAIVKETKVKNTKVKDKKVKKVKENLKMKSYDLLAFWLLRNSIFLNKI